MSPRQFLESLGCGKVQHDTGAAAEVVKRVIHAQLCSVATAISDCRAVFAQGVFSLNIFPAFKLFCSLGTNQSMFITQASFTLFTAPSCFR